jgi:hypothetical protein
MHAAGVVGELIALALTDTLSDNGISHVTSR